MKRIFALFAAATVATCSVMPAQAAVNARQFNQERNIDAGVRSGKLTQREARALRAEVRGIERQKRVYSRDGRYTRVEKARIHTMQDRLANKIDRMKSNGRRG